MDFLGYCSRRTFLGIVEAGAFRSIFSNAGKQASAYPYNALETMLTPGEAQTRDVQESQQQYIRSRIIHDLLHSLLQGHGYTPLSIRAFASANPTGAMTLSDSYIHRNVPFSVKIDLRSSNLHDLYRLSRDLNLERVIQSTMLFGSGVTLKDADCDTKGSIEIEDADSGGPNSILPLRLIASLSTVQKSAVNEFDMALLQMLGLHYTGKLRILSGMTDNPEEAYQKALERLAQLFPPLKAKRFS